MNIRKYSITIIATLGLLSPLVEANALIAKSLAKAATTTLGKAIAEKTVKESSKTVLNKISPHAAQLKDAFMNEARLWKISFEDTKMYKYGTEAFESCVANPTMRKMIALKAAEYTVTMPGFVLASAGDLQALSGTFLILSQHGIHGMAANAALLSGAASWYLFNAGVKHYNRTKEYNQRNNDLNEIDKKIITWSL